MAQNDALLWQMKLPHTDRISYLLGSMHILPGDAFRGMEQIKALIRSSDVLANEMDLRARSLMDPSVFRMETQLSQVLPQKKYDKLRRILLKAFQVDLDALGHLKPLIISNMLAEVVLGHSGMVGMDQYLFEYARSLDMPTTGVERVEEQAEIMTKIPLSYQIQSLMHVGKNVGAFRRKVLQMNQLYLNHELVKLHHTAKASLGKMRRVLLYERNQIMADRILEMMEDQTCFITIGAGHLLGQKGVLRFAKGKGIHIKPISL